MTKILKQYECENCGSRNILYVYKEKFPLVEGMLYEIELKCGICYLRFTKRLSCEEYSKL